MAVHGDWSKVVDVETLHEDDFEWSMTEALFTLGWGYGLLYFLGVTAITEKNIGEVVARYNTLTGLDIVKWRKGGEVVTMNADWLIRRIGISSNYDTMTRTQWVKTILTPLLDKVAEDTLLKIDKQRKAHGEEVAAMLEAAPTG